MAHQVVVYGFDCMMPERDLKLVIIEAAERIWLSPYTTAGSLMGNFTGDLMIEGRFARLLYRLHPHTQHRTPLWIEWH